MQLLRELLPTLCAIAFTIGFVGGILLFGPVFP
jgi:hypothetical protein